MRCKQLMIVLSLGLHAFTTARSYLLCWTGVYHSQLQRVHHSRRGSPVRHHTASASEHRRTTRGSWTALERTSPNLRGTTGPHVPLSKAREHNGSKAQQRKKNRVGDTEPKQMYFALLNAVASVISERWTIIPIKQRLYSRHQMVMALNRFLLYDPNTFSLCGNSLYAG